MKDKVNVCNLYSVTHKFLASHKKNDDKQWKPRPDAKERDALSGSTQFLNQNRHSLVTENKYKYYYYY